MSEKPMSEQPIDPFRAALTRKPKEVIAAITVGNVQALRTGMGRDEAEAFLRRHAAVIATFMLDAGISALRHLLEDKHDN